MKMKNFAIAIAMMFAMTLTANAQSQNIQQQLQTAQTQQSFDRISAVLELTTEQWQPVKTAFQQMNISLQTLAAMTPGLQMQQAWDKIQARHMRQMKRLLNQAQFGKYKEMFDLTTANEAAKYIRDTATK